MRRLDMKNPPDEVISLRGPGAKPPSFAVTAAIEVATWSPCQKSKRGVALYRIVEPMNPTQNDVIARYVDGWFGWNGPPEVTDRNNCIVDATDRRLCDGSPACRASCGERCVHAEGRALLHGGFTALYGPVGMHLVHAKVVDRELVAGGGPSCPECSKMILDAKIAGVWLYEQTAVHGAWRFYTAEEFHVATLKHRGIYQVSL